MSVIAPETSIYLIGPMGAGKSTLGRHLSQLLGLPFYDSDKVIVERTGADIPWIFDMEGEEGFRRREEEVIDELTQRENIVLATGGGAVTRAINRERLSQRGTVFYLWTPVSVQLARTRYDKNRPLLQTKNPEAVLEQLMTERHPLYEATAHHTISTASGNLAQVTERLLACFNNEASS
mgnify:FL=1